MDSLKSIEALKKKYPELKNEPLVDRLINSLASPQPGEDDSIEGVDAEWNFASPEEEESDDVPEEEDETAVPPGNITGGDGGGDGVMGPVDMDMPPPPPEEDEEEEDMEEGPDLGVEIELSSEQDMPYLEKMRRRGGPTMKNLKKKVALKK